MKKITLLMSLLITAVGFSQTTIDFEAGGLGADWTWVMDQNGSNPALEFVANPNTTGNTTATTAKFTAQIEGESYALTYSNGIGDITFTAENSLIKMWVKKNVISDVAIKFEGAAGLASQKKTVNTISSGEWEQLSFNFSSEIGKTFNNLVIIPDFVARSTVNVIYFDEITFHPAPADPAPTVAADTPPTRDANDVISLFSDAYTNVSVDTWSTAWDNVTLAEVQIAGNDTKKYKNLITAGIEHTGANGIDASGMTHLSMDIWSEDVTSLKVKLVDFKLDGYGGPNGRTEAELEFFPTKSTWVTIEIKLSDLAAAGMDAFSDISQMILTSNSSLTYVDNVYYWKAATAGVEDISVNSVKMYPNPAQGVVNFSSASSDALTVSVFDVLGKQVLQAKTVQSQLNISSLNPGMYFVKMTQGSNSSTKKLVVK